MERADAGIPRSLPEDPEQKTKELVFFQEKEENVVFEQKMRLGCVFYDF